MLLGTTRSRRICSLPCLSGLEFALPKRFARGLIGLRRILLRNLRLLAFLHLLGIRLCGFWAVHLLGIRLCGVWAVRGRGLNLWNRRGAAGGASTRQCRQKVSKSALTCPLLLLRLLLSFRPYSC